MLAARPRVEIVAARAAEKNGPLYTRVLVDHLVVGSFPPAEGGIEWDSPAAAGNEADASRRDIGGHLGFLDGTRNPLRDGLSEQNVGQ